MQNRVTKCSTSRYNSKFKNVSTQHAVKQYVVTLLQHYKNFVHLNHLTFGRGINGKITRRSAPEKSPKKLSENKYHIFNFST